MIKAPRGFKRLCHSRSVQKAALQSKRPQKHPTIGFPAAVASPKLHQGWFSSAWQNSPFPTGIIEWNSLLWKTFFFFLRKVRPGSENVSHAASPQRERGAVVRDVAASQTGFYT